MINTKERTTRSRRLNDRAYNTRENAVIAIPAESNWLNVRKLPVIKVILFSRQFHQWRVQYDYINGSI